MVFFEYNIYFVPY